MEKEEEKKKNKKEEEKVEEEEEEKEEERRKKTSKHRNKRGRGTRTVFSENARYEAVGSVFEAPLLW